MPNVYDMNNNELAFAINSLPSGRFAEATEAGVAEMRNIRLTPLGQVIFDVVVNDAEKARSWLLMESYSSAGHSHESDN